MAGTFWTTADVAKALNVSRQTVRQWVDDGVIPAVQFVPNGRLRFDEKALREAIAQKTARPRDHE